MSPIDPRARLSLRLCAGALAAAWIVYAAQALLGASAGIEDAFETWVYTGILLVCGALCVARGVLVPAGRWVWLVMGAGLLSWTGGEIFYVLTEPTAIPSPADLGYLLLYPAAYVAVVLLLRSQVASFPRSLWLDGAIAALAVAALAAAVAAGPIVESSVDGDQLAVATNLAYPIADLVLLAMVVGAFGLTGWRPGSTWILLGAGLLILALSDGSYLFQSARGTYVSNGVLDVGWTAAAMLIAAAAWTPPRTARPVRLTGARMVVAPLTAALIAIGVTTYDHYDRLTVGAQILASATLLAVAARMALAFVENQRMLEASRQEASRDALTGLGNRRLLTAELAPATTMPPAQGHVRMLVLMDLDGFKAYNDSFGHPAGDSLLVRLGARLEQVAKPNGTAFRMGGDEFCLLADVQSGMEDVLVASAAEAMAEHGDGFVVGASVGAVRLPQEAATPEAALHLADRRMYASKSRARTSAGRQTRDVLIEALKERVPDLHEHVTDVAELAVRVATELGMPAEERDEVARAAELHDVGKMAIPDAILDKPGPLNEDEWLYMRRHTLIGERILLAAPALRPVAQLVRSSHERWDGGGYPDGLQGEEIPIGARVVSVCDAYEAMVADRPYRAAIGHYEAVAELQRCAGTQFDPRVVTAFAAVTQAPSEGVRPG